MPPTIVPLLMEVHSKGEICSPNMQIAAEDSRGVPTFALPLWILATLIAIVPGGTFTRIGIAATHFAASVAASPMGKLCYRCNRPAVQSASYTDGSLRYFCELHPPPDEMRRTTPGEHGGNKFNPDFCRFSIMAFLGFGWMNLLLGFAQKTSVTIRGAVIGLAVSAGLWLWFSHL
jgi:hypothetical protein